MGFVKDVAAGTVLGGAFGLESSQEKAAKRAARTQADAGQRALDVLETGKQEAIGFIDPTRAQGFLESGASAAQNRFAPFAGVTDQALSNAAILTDPQAQFDFLQSNPLFQAALENANQQTLGLAAARGRLSSGDTLQALSQNTLLAASPLLAQQQQNVSNLLGFGAGIAGKQAGIDASLGSQLAGVEQSAQQALANAALGTGTQSAGLTTDIGAALAGGQVGAANARTQNQSNLINLGLTAAGLGFNPFGGTA